MSENETQLLRLLKERSLKRGTFRLASGGTSDYYVDGRLTAVFSEGARLIGEALYERTEGLGIDAIGGLAVGAVPLTTAAVIAYQLHGRRLEGFWVREEVKQHGRQQLIEGNLKEGARVVIVDDVITKGGSVIKAVNAVRTIGCEVVRVIALVDRLSGAEELFRANGIKDYRPLFTVRDLGVGGDAARSVEPAP